MAKVNIQAYKGTRDFYPEDQRLQNYIFELWKKTSRNFGYQQYNAPLLEPLDLYRLKNQSNDEIVNEQIYSFSDRGGREVALRPEMTPSVSRMVAAKRQELAYPLRLFSIPNLWRYERPQKGRLREHWQLNLDLFGVDGIEAEHELIMVAGTILKRFGASSKMFQVKINHRQLVDYALNNYLKLNEVQSSSLIRLVDRKAKMDRSSFIAACEQILSPTQREEGLGTKLVELLNSKKLQDLPAELKICPGYLELSRLFSLLEASNIPYMFDISIMRGFDYYTGVVFEIFDNDPDNNRSMFGGGRYDGLVASLGVESLATVGFGMGDVTLLEFLRSHNLLPKLQPELHLTVLLIGDVYQDLLPILGEMRREGLNLAVDFSGVKLSKQFEAVAKAGNRYVMLVGEDELTKNRFKIRDLKTGQEEIMSPERIVTRFLSQ